MGYYRRPRTQNEKWQYFASLDNDLGIRIKIRSKRKPRKLPHSWDSDCAVQQKNWKKFRKTQYKL